VASIEDFDVAFAGDCALSDLSASRQRADFQVALRIPGPISDARQL
jgi:hypothetical protein